MIKSDFHAFIKIVNLLIVNERQETGGGDDGLHIIVDLK
jgi:hypothetical protein